MAERKVTAFATTVQESHEWLKALTRTGGIDDELQAYSALRAVLHTLRDRLSVNEAVHLGAQFPMLIRGLYFEGWRPAARPLKERSEQDFLAHVEERLRSDVTLDARQVTLAVLSLLEDRISPGEMADVRSSLPKHVRALWPSEVAITTD